MRKLRVKSTAAFVQNHRFQGGDVTLGPRRCSTRKNSTAAQMVFSDADAHHVRLNAILGPDKGRAWAQWRLAKMLKRFTNRNDVGCPARWILEMCSSWTVLSCETASQWCRRISFDARWSQGCGGERAGEDGCSCLQRPCFASRRLQLLDKSDLMHLSTLRTDGWAMLQPEPA